MGQSSGDLRPDSLTITRPDDWHLHRARWRGASADAPADARQFGPRHHRRPTSPLVTTAAQASAYQIESAPLCPLAAFTLMTLYLTDNLPPEEIARAREGRRRGLRKLYPAGATTNSDAGVK